MAQVKTAPKKKSTGNFAKNPGKSALKSAVKAVQAKTKKKPAAKAKAATQKAKPIPDGYQVIIPYLTVHNVPEAIKFYAKAFGAKERLRVPGFDGKVGHAEITINGHCIMLTDEFFYLEAVSPKKLGGTTFGIHFYVKDVDKALKRAVDAGCRVFMPIEDQFCGNRSVGIADPFGHNWYLATHTEDMSKQEMYRRAYEYIEAYEAMRTLNAAKGSAAKGNGVKKNGANKNGKRK